MEVRERPPGQDPLYLASAAHGSLPDGADIMLSDLARHRGGVCGDGLGHDPHLVPRRGRGEVVDREVGADAVLVVDGPFEGPGPVARGGSMTPTSFVGRMEKRCRSRAASDDLPASATVRRLPCVFVALDGRSEVATV